MWQTLFPIWAADWPTDCGRACTVYCERPTRTSTSLLPEPRRRSEKGHHRESDDAPQLLSGGISRGVRRTRGRGNRRRDLQRGRVARGWQSSETREQVHQDRQTAELWAEAAKVRQALRLAAPAAPNGKEARPRRERRSLGVESDGHRGTALTTPRTSHAGMSSVSIARRSSIARYASARPLERRRQLEHLAGVDVAATHQIDRRRQ